MKNKNFLAVTTTSVTVISLELCWTRLFSAEFFYTFAFLVLSLAVMGLGLGALALYLFRGLNKEKNLNSYLLLTGLASIAGPALVFQLGLDFSTLYHDAGMMIKLLAAIVLLAAPNFFAGMALALVFKNNIKIINKLYMADLIAAGAGVFFIILIMNLAGTPAATFISSLPVIIASFIIGSRKGYVFSILISIALVINMAFSDDILRAEREEKAKVLHTHWDAMSKVKILEYNEYYRGINVDNHASTTVVRFNGDFSDPDLKKYDFFGINVGYLIRKFDHCSFLAIGAGGGKDALHALVEGAGEVHAVEVNPYINHLMTDGELAEFTGYIYRDPRVKVITEDARAYIRGFENKFDLIFSWSSNTYAALASGAFALAENYIYTTEAFVDYWHALSDSGFLVMEHHFYVPRLVSEIKEAFEKMGISDLEQHIAVYDMPEWRRKLILLSKKPLDNMTIINAIGGLGPQHHNISVLFPNSRRNSIVAQIINNDWEDIADNVPYDISPASDDRPFTPEMGLWKNLDFSKSDKIEAFEEFFGFPLAKLVILSVIIVTLVFLIPVNILPYLRKNVKKLRPMPWLYFFFIGMGFMATEVILIQKYTLLVGSPAYSIVTILVAVLISSGIGSFLSKRINTQLAFAAVILLLLIDAFILGYLIDIFGTMSLIPRILMTVLMILPLGFFMGMPFPAGASKAGRLVDWGFAVNGAGSVLGSAFAVLLAISYGFTAALLFASLCYILAMVIFKKAKNWI